MRIEINLSENEAAAIAQFLKRVSLSDYRALAESVDEAQDMQSAGYAIKEALAENGFAPR